ncbi:hypothetical protein [Sorangium cellulosum]|uniref:hypothetical protein n=1 Tax=Sorangium cellulosum TaxID=56 RepID=UPI0013E9BEB5|nr:hypothetical protein [Sorangium cellulosum]
MIPLSPCSLSLARARQDCSAVSLVVYHLKEASAAIRRARGRSPLEHMLAVHRQPLLEVELDVAALLAGVGLGLPGATFPAISYDCKLKGGLLLEIASVLVRRDVGYVPQNGALTFGTCP